MIAHHLANDTILDLYLYLVTPPIDGGSPRCANSVTFPEQA
jgi:hypothetical protein